MVYLTACGLLEAAAQCVFGCDWLILRNLVAMPVGINYVVAMVLALPAAFCVLVGVTGR